MQVSSRIKLLKILIKQSEWQVQLLQQQLHESKEHLKTLEMQQSDWQKRMQACETVVESARVRGASLMPETWLSYQEFVNDIAQTLQTVAASIAEETHKKNMLEDDVRAMKKRVDKYEEMLVEAQKVSDLAIEKRQSLETEDMVISRRNRGAF